MAENCIECNNCNEIVRYEGNVQTHMGIEQLYCPKCFDKYCSLYPRSPHLIAAKYQKKWCKKEFFLTKNQENAIVKATNRRDIITSAILVHFAKLEMGFKDIDFNRTYTKIMWVDGKAIGYYNITKSGERNHPCLKWIFIRSKCRGMGYGKQMWEDFCNSFPNESIAIENPNGMIQERLVKWGWAEETPYHEIKPKGRLRFV